MKKRVSTFLLLKLLALVCFSQASDSEAVLLQKLDSIYHSRSVARHFARLYLETTRNAIDFFQKTDTGGRHFITRLQTKFAYYFFQSAQEYEQKAGVNGHWSTYYADTSRSLIQYHLLGANAHVNGDIWRALTTEFTLEEIMAHKKHYFKYQKGLEKIYFNVYAEALESSPLIRTIHKISFGGDRLYGKIMLARWRKRQMKLSILYFTDKKKFDKKLTKLNRKMTRINNMILHHL